MRQRLRNGNDASGTVSRRLRKAGNLSGLHRRIGSLLTLSVRKIWGPLCDKDLFFFLGIFIMGACQPCILYRKRLHAEVVLRNQLGFHDSPSGDLVRFMGAAFSRNSQLFGMRLFFGREYCITFTEIIKALKDRKYSVGNSYAWHRSNTGREVIWKDIKRKPCRALRRKGSIGSSAEAPGKGGDSNDLR
jgi:hypothetical protein